MIWSHASSLWVGTGDEEEGRMKELEGGRGRKRDEKCVFLPASLPAGQPAACYYAVIAGAGSVVRSAVMVSVSAVAAGKTSSRAAVSL